MVTLSPFWVILIVSNSSFLTWWPSASIQQIIYLLCTSLYANSERANAFHPEFYKADTRHLSVTVKFGCCRFHSTKQMSMWMEWLPGQSSQAQTWHAGKQPPGQISQAETWHAGKQPPHQNSQAKTWHAGKQPSGQSSQAETWHAGKSAQAVQLQNWKLRLGFFSSTWLQIWSTKIVSRPVELSLPAILMRNLKQFLRPYSWVLSGLKGNECLKW